MNKIAHLPAPIRVVDFDVSSLSLDDSDLDISADEISLQLDKIELKKAEMLDEQMKTAPSDSETLDKAIVMHRDFITRYNQRAAEARKNGKESVGRMERLKKSFKLEYDKAVTETKKRHLAELASMFNAHHDQMDEITETIVTEKATFEAEALACDKLAKASSAALEMLLA